jgi:UDP-N-acetylmuramoylalanine--D-glutamate ligase
MNKEKLQRFNKKRIAILGLGIENQAILDFFLKHGIRSKFHIIDQRDNEELGERISDFIEKKEIRLIKQTEKNDLSTYDIVLRSPGFPLFRENLTQAKKKGTEVTSAMRLFFELCPTANIIGVTGSKGKGTTSSLIREMILKAGLRCYLGGNIGVAPFSFIDELQNDDWVVLELSSFQLEDFDVSPKISVFTNLSEEHLRPADPLNPNFHKSMDDYARAKLNILKYQKKGDWAVLNENFKSRPVFFSRGKDYALGRAKRIYFNRSEYPSKLIGRYNKENIAAAVEVARIIGVKPNDIKQAVFFFRGLPHRIEFTREVKGVKYYDNSFATTPEATMADLDSFVEPIILFLGGADKGSSFLALAKAIVKKGVKYIVLLDGTASNRINQELLASGFPSHKIGRVSSMPEAVALAYKQAKAGDVVLLSTACASFGMFNNYKERGDKFQEEVKRL